MLSRLLLLATLTAWLAACAERPDAALELTCRRAIPALNAEGATIRVTRSETNMADKRVRITYRATDPGAPPRTRFAICRFATESYGERRGRLTGVDTEQGPLSGPAFYFLNRFFLDTPEAIEATPEPAEAQTPIGEMSAGAALALQQSLAALPLVSLYGLLAIAYALVYGLVGRIFLAFGEFAAIGSVATLGAAAWLQWAGAAMPAVLLPGAAAVAVAAASLWGMVAARLMLRPLMGRSGQPALIASIGLAIAISEGLRLLQGTANRWLSPVWSETLAVARAGDFVVTATSIGLLVAGIALLAACGLFVLMGWTRFGRAWRAVADDPLAASLFGVSRERVLALSVTLACGLAGLSGTLMTFLYGGVGFAGGAMLGLKALIGAVLGGIGSIGGAFVGGLLVGAIEALWSATMPIAMRDMVLFAVLATVIVFRPGGLFGYGELTPRRF